MSVVNVKVKYIREKGYNNLEDWMSDNNNIYIGRAGIVFINKKRYPTKSSEFHNPFKIGKHGDRNDVLNKYKSYILDKIEKSPELLYKLKSMKGKNLGCWCHPESCHGDILLELIKKYTTL
jgi:hypothetical protein